MVIFHSYVKLPEGTLDIIESMQQSSKTIQDNALWEDEAGAFLHDLSVAMVHQETCFP
jgi:hypothetical protein